MDLLPRTVEEFKSEEYWDEFFRKRKDVFEWYGEYSDLCELLNKYIKETDKILMLGCGNSALSEDLYDVGYLSIVNIDISDTVINKMKARNEVKRPKMTYTKMDVLKMDFESESFQVVIDKATLDAMFPNSQKETIEDVDIMFGGIHRVLKTGGRYICITLAQDHILKKLLEAFSTGWFIRVHRVSIQSENVQSGPKLPAFFFVFTKCLSIAGRPPMKVLEVAVDGLDSIKRVDSTEELEKSVKQIQHFAYVKHQLGKLSPGESYALEMYSIGQEEPRYTLSVVDQPHSKATNGKFAIFIVPQGREVEWLFSSKEGQQQVAESAGFERLVIVSLSRGHEYQSIDAIKKELDCKVMEIAPNGLKKSVQVPYLSVGNDVGSREVRYKGESGLSGKYIVEDVCGDSNVIYRRLIFLNNKMIVQSEARVVTQTETSRNKGKKKSKPKSKSVDIDHGFIPNIYQTMVAGFSLVDGFSSQEKRDVLLIGLGGGNLAMFIHKHFPQVHLDAVEIDLEVVNIAKQWFGFVENDRVRSHVQDGKDFIHESSKQGHQFDAILLDIDCKDRTQGLSGPPMEFVDVELLQCVKRMLKVGGVVILNLVCRKSELRRDVLSNLHKVLQSVCSVKFEEDVNEIVFAQDCEDDNGLETRDKLWTRNAEMLESQIKANFRGQKTDVPDLCQIVKSVQFVKL